MEIGPKVTILGRCSNFVVAKFDLGVGDMNVATINISIVNLHTPEPLCPDTHGDGGERSTDSTTTTTGDTNITYPFSVRVFEAPAPDPLNDESLRVLVAQPMAKTPVRTLCKLTEASETACPLSLLTESGGSVVGSVLAHMMYESTVEMPPPLPLP